MAKKKMSLATKGAIGLAGGVVAAFAIYKGLQTRSVLKNITVRLTSVKVISKDINNPKLALTFDIVNEGSFDFRFTGFQGNAVYKKANISTFFSTEIKEIPARSTGQITLQSAIDGSQIIAELLELLFVDGALQPIQILGTMTINGMKVPINEVKQLTT